MDLWAVLRPVDVKKVSAAMNFWETPNERNSNTKQSLLKSSDKYTPFIFLLQLTWKEWTEYIPQKLRLPGYEITFTSFSASEYSSSSGLLSSLVLTSFVGRSHASFIDFSPKNMRSVTAAYSPIGRAVHKLTRLEMFLFH